MTKLLGIKVITTKAGNRGYEYYFLDEFTEYDIIGDDDERGFYIVEHNSKYVLCDNERAKIVKYYENDPEMVQVYEDVITYMVKMN